jgi:hypothetical protein
MLKLVALNLRICGGSDSWLNKMPCYGRARKRGDHYVLQLFLYFHICGEAIMSNPSAYGNQNFKIPGYDRNGQEKTGCSFDTNPSRGCRERGIENLHSASLAVRK